MTQLLQAQSPRKYGSGAWHTDQNGLSTRFRLTQNRTFLQTEALCELPTTRQGRSPERRDYKVTA